MTGDRGLYFLPAEFLTLLEMAGGGRCSLLSAGEEPDDGALRQAFVSLFQREMIARQGDGFVLTSEGKLFENMRNAPWAVSVFWRQPRPGRALCYVSDNALWLVELVDVIVAVQYRVRQMEREELGRWFLENGLLERPILTDADTAEFGALFGGLLEEAGGPVELLIEKYCNGGRRLVSHEVIRCRGQRIIRSQGPDGIAAAVYTKEALSRMLADCFGKGNYDL